MQMSKITTKWCGRCKNWLPLSEFHKNKANKHNGLASYCKKCQQKYQQEYYKKHKSESGFIPDSKYPIAKSDKRRKYIQKKYLFT